jgi:hypothetical protein
MDTPTIVEAKLNLDCLAAHKKIKPQTREALS